jgi:hypothetical protein
LVKAMQKKPVKFIAVGANMTPADALLYQRSNNLTMPIFADNLGIMQARYGFKISLQNIWQYRIIDADGKLAGYNLEQKDIDAVVDRSQPETKFKSLDVDAKFAPVLDLFEYNQFAVGMKQLTTYKKTAKKTELAAIGKIQDAVKQEASTWVDDAKGAVESDPIRAYDLYSKIAAAVATTEDLAKDAQKSIKTLSTQKAVKAELAARTAYQKVLTAMSGAPASQKAAAAKMLADMAKKHPDTPSAEKAKALADELGYEEPPPKKK